MINMFLSENLFMNLAVGYLTDRFLIYWIFIRNRGRVRFPCFITLPVRYNPKKILIFFLCNNFFFFLLLHQKKTKAGNGISFFYFMKTYILSNVDECDSLSCEK